MITEQHVLNILKLQLPLYPLKCDVAAFDVAHFSVFVKIAGFDKLVKMSFCLVII